MHDKSTPAPFPAVRADAGVMRRVLSDSAELMMVEFAFEQGAVGKLHNHVHVQATYVYSGRFRFTVGDEQHDLQPGDSIVIPSNVMHGCTALEAGKLIDTFTPRRDDFLPTA